MSTTQTRWREARVDSSEDSELESETEDKENKHDRKQGSDGQRKPARGSGGPRMATGNPGLADIIELVTSSVSRALQPDNSRSARGHFIKVPNFNGKGDQLWEAYYSQFSLLAKKHHWATQEKLDRLICALLGPALNYFARLPTRPQEDFDCLIVKMSGRFGTLETAFSKRHSLKTLKQDPDKSLREFADQIQYMINGGYPADSEEKHNLIAFDTFMEGVSHKTAATITSVREPEKTEDALRYIELCKSTQKHFKVCAVEATFCWYDGKEHHSTTLPGRDSHRETSAEVRKTICRTPGDKHFNLEEVRILHEDSACGSKICDFP